jgi:hypothetical protein
VEATKINYVSQFILFIFYNTGQIRGRILYVHCCGNGTALFPLAHTKNETARVQKNRVQKKSLRTHSYATKTAFAPDLLEVNISNPSRVKSSELLPSLHDRVCGSASSQGYHVRLEFCLGYCQEPGIQSMLVLGSCVALLEPTASDRAGYYCGGSTFVTTPHESDGFHVSYAGETCVQEECDESVLQVTYCLGTLHLSQFSPLGDYQACVKGNLWSRNENSPRGVAVSWCERLGEWLWLGWWTLKCAWPKQDIFQPEHLRNGCEKHGQRVTVWNVTFSDFPWGPQDHEEALMEAIECYVQFNADERPLWLVLVLVLRWLENILSD